MKRGFTVLELLVASLLLGMLMTILTMIFNQSSIAWRTGLAGLSDLDEARETISDVRYKADNTYMWDGENYIHSVFDEHGNPVGNRTDYINSTFHKTDKSGITFNDGTDVKNSYQEDVSCGEGKSDPQKNYIVNVRSRGPDRKKETRYDNIYSVPYDPNDWNW